MMSSNTAVTCNGVPAGEDGMKGKKGARMYKVVLTGGLFS